MNDERSSDSTDHKSINRRMFIAGAGAAAVSLAVLGREDVIAQDVATPAAGGTPAEAASISSGVVLGGSAKTGGILPVVPPEVADISGNWPAPQNDLKANRSAVGSAITAANVAKLAPEWFFSLDGRKGMTSNPIVTKDTVYIQDMLSNVIALDRTSGRVKWETRYGVDSNGPNGVAIGYGLVVATIGDIGAVVGLDVATGTEKWRAQIGFPPTEGTDMAPLIYDGTIYVSSIPGTSKSFYQRGQFGVLYALDVLTGHKLWSWDTVAGNGWGAPALTGGGGLWYPPSVDDKGNIFFGVGNPAPWPSDPQYPNGSNRPGDNLYTDSMVSLDTTTGGVRWHVQALKHDIMDHDFQQTPVLADATINGLTVKLAIGGGKTGTVIAADAGAGMVIWKTAVGVHQNDELTAIPSGQDTVIEPGSYGGVETPMAYASNLVFVTNVDWPVSYASSSEFSKTTTFGIDTAKGQITALNVADGTLKWNVKFDSMQLGAATVANDIVFTAGLDGTVTGLKIDTGEAAFSWKAPAGINAPLAVAGDMLFVGAATYPVKPSKSGGGTPVTASSGSTPAAQAGAAAPKVVEAFIALRLGAAGVDITAPRARMR